MGEIFGGSQNIKNTKTIALLSEQLDKAIPTNSNTLLIVM